MNTNESIEKLETQLKALESELKMRNEENENLRSSIEKLTTQLKELGAEFVRIGKYSIRKSSIRVIEHTGEKSCRLDGIEIEGISGDELINRIGYVAVYLSSDIANPDTDAVPGTPGNTAPLPAPRNPVKARIA